MVLLLKRKEEYRDREVAPTRRGFEWEIETTRKPNAPAIFLTSIRHYAILSGQVWNQCPIVGSDSVLIPTA